jgi:phosphatidylinositol alpha-1,6-mannosyltransferase
VTTVAIVVPRAHPDIRDERFAGCAVHRVLPSRRMLFFRRALGLPLVVAAAVRMAPIAARADIVHALKDYPYSLIAAVAALLAHKPLVVMAYGTYSVLPFHSRLERTLLRFVYWQAARIVSISAYTRRRLAALTDADKIVVIVGGVDVERLSGGAEPPACALPQPFLLSVGQIKERKGFDVCVRAFQRLAPDFPDLHYFLVGDCGDEQYVRRLREVIGGDGDAIRLLGPVDDETLRGLYHRCELFWLAPRTDRAGHFEGFGLVFLEASACGKPVIGTLECGVEDAIVDGQTGLLVPPDDVDRLARALRSLLEDRDLARRLGDEGRRRARQLSWDGTAERIAALYGTVIGLRTVADVQ